MVIIILAVISVPRFYKVESKCSESCDISLESLFEEKNEKMGGMYGFSKSKCHGLVYDNLSQLWVTLG